MEKTLDIYFRKINLEKIISNYISAFQKEGFYYQDPKNILDESNYFPNYGKEEKENIFTLNKNQLKVEYVDETSVFNLLVNYAKKCLREIEKEPVCRYEHLLNWSETTRHLGEELITTAFFAYSDFIFHKNRNFFSWRPITSSDNTRIANLLKKGIAENHFHLKASAQHDSIAWVSLMNNITNRSEEFKKFDKKEGHKLYNLIKKACYIRLYLFKLVENNTSTACSTEHEPETSTTLSRTQTAKNSANNCRSISNKSSNISSLPDIKELLSNDFIDMFVPQIQSELNALKLLHGFSFNLDGKNQIPDYCIKNNVLESNFNGNIFLYGERNFLYRVFKAIFSNNLKDSDKELFYIYLVIKSKFRENLIQLNNKVGLANFIDYEQKKEVFIKENSIYEKFLHNLAISSSVKNQNIVSLEARITPKEKAKKIAKTIKNLDRNISLEVFHKPDFSRFDAFINREMNKEQKDDKVHFYTLHFIKEKDKKASKYTVQPRFFKLRKKLKTQAHAVSQLRESLSPTSQRIFGIDSASQEIGVRPEIFAQVFRFLKNHNTTNKNEYLRVLTAPKLGSTFHAGEDFLDLVDGLRYIDEAIRFLNLEQGDRLGHALALGIDVQDYYNFKNQKVYLPKQDLLDNIVWLLAKIRKYAVNDASLVYYLEKKYNQLFLEIYKPVLESKNLASVPTHSNYFNAWKLRGDNPILYSSGKLDKNIPCLTNWDKYSKNQYCKKTLALREIDEIAYLYHLYHYDYNIREIGAQIEEFEIEANYIQAVKQIQKAMQFEVLHKGIGIETNPSSNYIIGSIKKYSKHPIISWFNLGLEIDPEKIKNSPQIFVSINTDDQGIFNTYLENEYALMALALEKEKDEFGKNLYNTSMIYDWLDRIRQMGIEQSFMGR